MQIKYDERLDYSQPCSENEWKLFTANSFIRKDGCLVMGRGAASDVLNNYPEISRTLGHVIKDACGHLGVYGLILVSKHNIGAFQVKKRFDNGATISLIKRSGKMLKKVAEDYPDLTFHMNFPGIGNGGLPYMQVFRTLEMLYLPNNVILYKDED